MWTKRGIKLVVIAAAMTALGTTAWAQGRSDEALAGVVGKQIVIFYENGTAGSAVAADNAAAQLPSPLPDNLLTIIYEEARAADMNDTVIANTLSDMALLAGGDSALQTLVDQIQVCCCFYGTATSCLQDVSVDTCIANDGTCLDL